jgi:hypothetical protein
MHSAISTRWPRGVVLVVALALGGTAIAGLVFKPSHVPPEDHRVAAYLVALACALFLAAGGRQANVATFRHVAFWRWLFSGTVLAFILTIMLRGGRGDARAWLLAGCTLWLGAIVHGVGRLERHGAARLAEVLAFNLSLFVVVAELSLRVYGAFSGKHLLLNKQLDAYRLEPHRAYGGLLCTNSRGYVGREFELAKPPGVRRIAALGDSFAVGVVKQENNYLHLLEGLCPGTEVYNFGIAGCGPREYEQILREEVWPYQPDLVLVSIFVGNDILGWWRLPSTERLDPGAFRLFVALERLGKLAREQDRRWSDDEGTEPTRSPLDFRPMSRATHLTHESSRLAICRPSQVERWERAWSRAFHYLDRIEAQCKSRGVALRVVLIPDEFQVNSVVLDEALEFGGIPAADVDLTLPQRRLLAWFADRQIPCLDLLPHFVDQADTYKPRDTHWNEKGNRIAAEAISAWLE